MTPRSIGGIAESKVYRLETRVAAAEDAIDLLTAGAGAATWGLITGTLSSQTDLAAALSAKEPTIAAGGAGQYWRGDKTWQTLDKAAIGLGSVENKSSATIRGELTSGNITTALGFTPYSDANPSGYITGITSGMVTTALGYTPTSVTGLTGTQSVAAFKTGLSLVKADVGLGSVDNTADSAKNVLSATKLTTARTIGMTGDVTWSSGPFDGSGNVTAAATVTKINGVALSGLATGILKNTTGTGVPSIAVAADFPTLNQSTTGSAATLTTGRAISMSGDVTWTVTFDGSAAVSAAGTIAAGAVSLAKMANVATGTVFYRKTAGTGAPEVQTLATLKTDLAITESDVTNLTTDLAAKAPLASPTFTGTPAAPTAGAGTSTAQIATTAFVATSFAPLASPQITGLPTFAQPAPTAKNATTALTAAEVLTLIITTTSTTAVSLTWPTGTNMDAAISPALAAGQAFQVTFINLGSSSGAVTMVDATGFTATGSKSIPIGTSATFLVKKTASNTFIAYRQ